MTADINGQAEASAPLFLKVAAIRVTGGVKVYDLVDAEGEVLPAAEPGAHIGLHLPNGVERQYSLIHAEAAPTRYVIAVKRDPASRGGSSYIHDHLKVGDGLSVDPPRNNFPLAVDAPHTILIAGGIGVTPMWCMIQRLEALGLSWRLHYAARSLADAPFAEELGRLPQTRLHLDDQEGVVLPVSRIVADAPEGAHLYCCGPAPMLAAFEIAAAAAGIAPDRVHLEYFTQKYEADKAGGFMVELARTGQQVRVEEGESILDAVRKVGVSVVSSCEEGICGACETRVIAGEPDHRDAILSEGERAEGKTMFICCSGSKSERLVLDL